VVRRLPTSVADLGERLLVVERELHQPARDVLGGHHSEDHVHLCPHLRAEPEVGRSGKPPIRMFASAEGLGG
jgi:hypothetical protein